MSKKIYVIDTNVIMYAGKKALTSFEDNEVVIPFVVIEELEKKRLEDGLVGSMARFAIRELDMIRGKGKLKDGIVVNDDGGLLRIEMNHRDRDELPPRLLEQANNNDNRILTVAHNLYMEQQRNAEKGTESREVILVTNDLPMRIKADSLFDMEVQPFYTKGNIYSGLKTEFVSSNFMNELYATSGKLDAPKKLLSTNEGIANQAVLLKSETNPSHTATALISGNEIRKIDLDRQAMKTLVGKSLPQKIALEYLYDRDTKIVSIGGKAGTGKTLMSVVSAMDQVEGNKAPYGKISIIRPIYSVGGQDIGFLKGDAEDKMEPWTKAVYDSVEGIVDSKIIHKMREDGVIEVMPATFLRGRTFHNSFVIVDEAQNFEPSVLLTILSRIGKGSKIVFLWDATQKDNEKLGYNDGIVSVVDKLKDSPMFAHISLMRSERSDVAELAGNILEDYIN